MRKLSEYMTDGSDWLKAGWYTVEVKDFECFEYNTGNPGVTFVVTDKNGSQGKATFALSGDGPKRLAWFADACGLTESEMNAYDVDKNKSHNVLVGHKVQVHIVHDGKYHKVGAWLKLGEEVSIPSTQPAHAEAKGEVQEDEIPF